MRELRKVLCGIVHNRSDELQAPLLCGAGMRVLDAVGPPKGAGAPAELVPRGRIGPVNHHHTDIDLFTVLPAATRPGLQFRSGNGWEVVGVGPSDVIVLPGELLHHFGGLPAAEHRVISDGSERMSASLFVNADPALHVEGHGRVADLFDARLAAVRRTSDRDGG